MHRMTTATACKLLLDSVYFYASCTCVCSEEDTQRLTTNYAADIDIVDTSAWHAHDITSSDGVWIGELRVGSQDLILTLF